MWTAVITQISRYQALSYRISAQGLHRNSNEPRKLRVLDLGLQDTPGGSARQALAARLTDASNVDAIAVDSVVMAWTIRAAPHQHRRVDVPGVAEALFPLSEADAYARMGSWAGALQKSGVSGINALRETADVLATVVKAPTPKGEASRAVTERISPQLRRFCPGCQSTHVFEDLFRYAALEGGIVLDVEQSPIELVPTPDWPGPPERNEGIQDMISSYLRFHGPAGPIEVAGFLGTKPAEIRSVWPASLAEVTLEGRKAWALPDKVGALVSPPGPPVARLLPPSDPYLQARDRCLIVPDRKRHSEIWKSIGSPGVVLMGTEIVGTWKPRTGSKARVSLTISLSDGLTAPQKMQVESEAERIAVVRGQELSGVDYKK